MFLMVGILVLLAALGFIFRKNIVEKIINANIDISIISSAQAQSPKTSDPPQDAPDYLPISNEYAVVSAKPGILGFQMVGELKELPQKCEDAMDVLFLTAFVLADISDEDYYLKVNECMKKDLKGKRWVLGYGAAQIPVTSSEKREIDKIWKSLDKTKELVEILDSKSFDLDFGDKKNLSHFAKTLSRLEGHEGLIADIARIYIFSGLGNQGKAGEIANKYLNQPLYERFYDMEYVYFQSERLREKIAKMLSASKNRFERNIRFDAVVNKLFIEASEDEKDAMDSEMDLPPTRNKMLSLIKSPTLGAQTPLVWMSWGQKNMSPQNFKKALETVAVSTLPENLLALKYFVPESSEKRAAMAKAFMGLLKSKDPKKETLFLEIIKNEQWRKYLASKDGQNVPPVFKLKREHFAKNLDNNRAILFSTFNLLKMGDYQRDRFLKTLAVRSHGLPSTQLLPIQ